MQLDLLRLAQHSSICQGRTPVIQDYSAPITHTTSHSRIEGLFWRNYLALYFDAYLWAFDMSDCFFGAQKHIVDGFAK